MGLQHSLKGGHEMPPLDVQGDRSRYNGHAIYPGHQTPEERFYPPPETTKSFDERTIHNLSRAVYLSGPTVCLRLYCVSGL